MEKNRIIHKALEEVSGVYKDLQNASGLNCLESCGQCCDNPNIFVRPSELLPAAELIYRQGQSDEVLEKLAAMTVGTEHKKCFFFQKLDDSHRGRCLAYEGRPLLCRSFGVFLRVGKSGKREFSVCKPMKENQADLYQKLQKEVDNFHEYNLIDEVSYKFYQVDMDLAQEAEVQINLALLLALKKVVFYFELLEKESHEG